MSQVLKSIKFEYFHRMAETLPVPANAFGVFFDEHREVILVYEEEELEEAA